MFWKANFAHGVAATIARLQRVLELSTAKAAVISHKQTERQSRRFVL